MHRQLVPPQYPQSHLAFLGANGREAWRVGSVEPHPFDDADVVAEDDVAGVDAVPDGEFAPFVFDEVEVFVVGVVGGVQHVHAEGGQQHFGEEEGLQTGEETDQRGQQQQVLEEREHGQEQQEEEDQGQLDHEEQYANNLEAHILVRDNEIY